MRVPFIVAVTAALATTSAIAGDDLPPSCQRAAQFIGACRTDVTNALRAAGVAQKETWPTASEVSKQVRQGVQQVGYEKQEAMCEQRLVGIARNLGNMATIMGMKGRQASDACTAQVAWLAAAADSLSEKVATKDDAARAQSSHADLALPWAQSAKQGSADLDDAYASAKSALPAVTKVCPDAFALRQFPHNTATKPVALIASRQCGFAVTYWPDSGEVAQTTDATEVEGWSDYCTTPMNTSTQCEPAHPAFAAK